MRDGEFIEIPRPARGHEQIAARALLQNLSRGNVVKIKGFADRERLVVRRDGARVFHREYDDQPIRPGEEPWGRLVREAKIHDVKAVLGRRGKGRTRV
jgi:hypothetical protein